MGGSSHLVARQTLEILGADRFECEALAARASSASALLAAAVEQGLDRADSSGDRLRFDRIELELGPFSPAQWEESLAGAIRDRLPGQIVEAVRRSEARRNDPAGAAVQLLEEFARSGRLPWWCAASDTPQSAVRTLQEAACQGHAVRALLGRWAAAERLINQLGDRDLLALVELAMPELAGKSEALLEALATIGEGWPSVAPGVQPRSIRPAVWRALLAEVAIRPPAVPAPLSGGAHFSDDTEARSEFVKAVAKRLGASSAEAERGAKARGRIEGPQRPSAELIGEETRPAPLRFGALLAARAKAAGAAPAAAEAIAERIAAIVPSPGERSEAAMRILNSTPGPAGLAELIAMLVSDDAVSPLEAEQWCELLTPSSETSEEHDCVAVPASGLAIAWPFLPAFFESLELIEKNAFRGVAEAHRAVGLLHFLATGALVAPEQELPLAKLLCGLGIETVHEPGEPLCEHETKSADALLDAMIGHAPMLGKISREGLRSAFLARPGSLTTRDGHWLLRVERRSIDVLLDRLDWNFGWIQLPWMEAPLQVEW